MFFCDSQSKSPTFHHTLQYCMTLVYLVIQYWHKELDILFCSITPANLGQLSKPGTVLESARPEDSKTIPES